MTEKDHGSGVGGESGRRRPGVRGHGGVARLPAEGADSLVAARHGQVDRLGLLGILVEEDDGERAVRAPDRMDRECPACAICTTRSPPVVGATSPILGKPRARKGVETSQLLVNHGTVEPWAWTLTRTAWRVRASSVRPESVVCNHYHPTMALPEVPDEPDQDPADQPSRQRIADAPQLMPLRAALVRSVGTGIAFVAMLFALFYLLIGHPHLAHEPLTSDGLFNLLKLAFAVVAGIGGTVALVMNYRKQRLAEIKAEQETGAEARAGRVELREQDKLFTERFTQAAQQIGSDRAAVRLAGTYALARIADDSIRDRPTCLKFLCAYLQMPWTPDRRTDTDADAAADLTDAGERQVRLAAQSLLAERLRPESSGFWPAAQVDLRGATLVEANFDGCAFAQASFEDARFISGASFGSTYFSNTASFKNAHFEDSVAFVGSTFAARSDFNGAKFDGNAFLSRTSWALAAFEGTSFSGLAHFQEAAFNGVATFLGSQFNEESDFSNAHFRAARFDATSFHRTARFLDTVFAEPAMFAKASFDQEARFDTAKFEADAWFSKARFGEAANFADAEFDQDAWFHGSRFTQLANFKRTTFGRGVWFDSTIFAGSTRFDTAVFNGGARFTTTVFTGPAWFDAATFNSEARFDNARFDKAIKFDEASFAADFPPIWPSGFDPSKETDQEDPAH